MDGHLRQNVQSYARVLISDPRSDDAVIPEVPALLPVLSLALLLVVAMLPVLLPAVELAAVVPVRKESIVCNWALEVPKALFSRLDVTRQLLIVILWLGLRVIILIASFLFGGSGTTGIQIHSNHLSAALVKTLV